MSSIKTNLGRVQGGSVFFSVAQSEKNVKRETLTPANILPLVGDAIFFANGDIRQIESLETTTVTCGDVVAVIQGAQGKPGPMGSIVSVTIEEV